MAKTMSIFTLVQRVDNTNLIIALEVGHKPLSLQ